MLCCMSCTPGTVRCLWATMYCLSGMAFAAFEAPVAPRSGGDEVVVQCSGGEEHLQCSILRFLLACDRHNHAFADSSHLQAL